MGKHKNTYDVYNYDNIVNAKQDSDAVRDTIKSTEIKSSDDFHLSVADGSERFKKEVESTCESLKKKVNKSLKDNRHRSNVRYRQIFEELAKVEAKIHFLEDEVKKYKKWDIIFCVLLIVSAVINFLSIFF